MDVRTGEIIIAENHQAAKELMENAKSIEEIAGEVLRPRQWTKPPDDFEKQVNLGYIVEIRRLPKPSCKHCYGRGHVGKNIETSLYVPCSCVL